LHKYFLGVGFCTWDAFYSSVDSDKVSSGLDSLSDAGVTVKYVILDDGWQSTALSGKRRDENEKAPQIAEITPPSLPMSVSKTDDSLVQGDEVQKIGSLSTLAVAGTGSAIVEGEDGELSGAQIDGSLAAQKMLEKESSVIVQFFTQVKIYLFSVDDISLQLFIQSVCRLRENLPSSASISFCFSLSLHPYISLPHTSSFSFLKAVSGFYTKYVEQGAPDSWPVKLWAGLSQNTILKEKLIEFFDSQTDFSKRLTSWKANSKVKNEKNFPIHTLYYPVT
jgi:Raffinose synthase or seed imbibition protein Sip1